MVKVCGKCKTEKLLTEFNYSKSTKDGLRNRCKSCRKKDRKANKEYYKEYGKQYYQANKENLKERSKQWREVNKEHYNQYRKQKRITDPLYKMTNNLRTRTSTAFKNKGYRKNTKTQEMLGVDWEIAKQHIERQFTKGMSWSNHGEWHIDHIIPLSSANTPERLKKLCHYTNLQPMWAVDNLSKSDSINGQQTLLRI